MANANTNLRIPAPPERVLLLGDTSRLVSPFGPGHENLTLGQVESEVTDFTYYLAEPGSREVLASTALRSLVQLDGDQDEKSVISKMLTAFVCLFPGEKDNLNHPMSSIRPGLIDAEYAKYLADFVKPIQEEQSEDEAGNVVTNHVEYIPDSLLGMMPSTEVYSRKEMYALLAVGLYGIVKEVNDANQTAFTERRKSAVIRQLKIPADATINMVGNWWTKESLETIHHAFTVYVSARISLISEICRWSTSPVTDVRSWVWGQVRLVRGHGMVPMEAMSSFVNACTHIIQGHTVLYEEALIFLQAKAEFDQLDPFQRNFNKAIMGNLYSPLPVNRMQNLLGASVAYGKIASKTFGNYRGGRMDPVVQTYVTAALSAMM